MSTHTTSPVIAVVGATGNQGSGVIKALLASKTPDGGLWYVRGITRDPNSSRAKQFLSDNQTSDNRLSLVSGDTYDKDSLQEAFAGAYGVFAMTSETNAGRVLENEEDMKHEVKAGQNMVLAAEECGVKHFVFSTLPDMIKATGGRYVNIYHMDNKHEVEKFARERLSGGFTGLIPGLHVPSLTVQRTLILTRMQGSFIAICVGHNTVPGEVSSARYLQVTSYIPKVQTNRSLS